MNVINIKSGSTDPIARILSNLSFTPFSYGGYNFYCVESALQGIKFADKKERQQVFSMDGHNALKVGRKITLQVKDDEIRYVYWGNKKFLYNSKDHRLLIAAFIAEKVRQNPEVQNALMSTKGTFIYHDAGKEHPKTSLPEKLFIEILLSQRKILLKLANLK